MANKSKRRLEARAKKRAAKRSAIENPGFKSRYAQKQTRVFQHSIDWSHRLARAWIAGARNWNETHDDERVYP